MALRTTIDCDRCGVAVDTGVTYTVDRIIVGANGDTLNINKFDDRRDWAFCTACAIDLVDFIKAGH